MTKPLEYRATRENLVITYQPSGNGGGETVGPACGGVWEGAVPESVMVEVKWKVKSRGRHGSVKEEQEKEKLAKPRCTGDLRCAAF